MLPTQMISPRLTKCAKIALLLWRGQVGQASSLLVHGATPWAERLAVDVQAAQLGIVLDARQTIGGVRGTRYIHFSFRFLPGLGGSPPGFFVALRTPVVACRDPRCLSGTSLRQLASMSRQMMAITFGGAHHLPRPTVGAASVSPDAQFR
jgi:hypothetical protein